MGALILPEVAALVRLVNGNLSRSIRKVHHIARQGNTGEALAHFLMYCQALFHGNTKVRVARDGVDVVEVVGDHAMLHEALRERDQHARIVVYALEEHGLVEQRNPRPAKPTHSLHDDWAQFVGMVCVKDDPDRGVMAEQVQKALVHSRWCSNRGACVNPNDLKVGSDPLEEFL